MCTGFHTINLAFKGYKIKAIDKSDIALNKLKEHAIKHSLLDNIELINCEIRDFKFKEKYYTIICTYVLHFLKKKEYINMINKIKNNTIDKGINFIAVFTKEGALKSNEGFHPFDHGELKSYYRDWEIISYEEKMVETMTIGEDGKNLMHQAAILVARKK